MPKPTQDLTLREKAALIFQIYSGCTWIEAYSIAAKAAFKDVTASPNINRIASAWKKRMQPYYKDQKAIFEAELQERIEKAIQEHDKKKEIENKKIDGESERTEKTGERRSNRVDYADPENRKRLYNDIIARAKDDPKTQLDAAKTFEQLQRDDRQAAKEQKQVRAYLPLQCSECPLYIKIKAKKG